MKSEIKIIRYDVTDSTSERAKQYAKGGEWDGGPTVFIADSQTMGRGRYARKFYSENATGVYLSLLFKPDSTISGTTAIVAHTANSMIKAIEERTKTEIKIKWVNDLILGEKKLGGILIEGGLRADGQGYDYLISGIGVNLFGNSLPHEIRDVATTLEAQTGQKVDKDELTAAFIEHFFEELDGAASADAFDFYRSRLITLGADVIAKSLTEEYEAKATDLLSDYSLLVTLPDGTQKRIFTGEVSVKPKSQVKAKDDND